jgi:hypothetical protein
VAKKRKSLQPNYDNESQVMLSEDQKWALCIIRTTMNCKQIMMRSVGYLYITNLETGEKNTTQKQLGNEGGTLCRWAKSISSILKKRIGGFMIWKADYIKNLTKDLDVAFLIKSRIGSKNRQLFGNPDGFQKTKHFIYDQYDIWFIIDTSKVFD